MSERERIGRLVARFAQAPLIVPSGDDAAVALARGAVTVTSVDAVVDGVHFTLGAWPPLAIGQKAVGSALSDLAAMGARAGEIYVSAGLPKDFTSEQFEELTAGIDAAAAAEQGVHVAGGDLVASPVLWLSVTVVGYADDAEAVVTRGGAAAGDTVVVTGDLGGAARALELIEQGAGLEPREVAKQFAPRPRLAAGLALARAGATAMIDISDGLAHDAGHIAGASGVQLRIELEKLPLARGITDAAYAASSGEEYELLATIPPDRLADAQRAAEVAEVPLSVIGTVVAGEGAVLVDPAGREVELGGFDHFD